MNDTLYQKIQLQKVSEQIVEQIKSLIKQGRLQPGEKLPPERAFADMLGVGRSSLREAVNTLTATGFLEVRKRQGIYVRSMSTELVSDPLRAILTEDRSALPCLYELRKDIELAAAALAAERHRPEDLAAIEAPVKRMEQGAARGAIGLEDDLEFHLAVARATRNFLRVHILKSIFDLSGEFLGNIMEKLSQAPDNIPVIYTHHLRIFEAIAARDADGAKARMKEHLEWVAGQVVLNDPYLTD